MKIIPFDTLYTQNITFKDIVPTIRYHRENVKYSLISPAKPYNTLVYYYSCNAKYTFPNHPPVVAVPGNIIYIPAHTPYEIVNYNTHHPTPGSVKIEFGMYDSLGRVVLWQLFLSFIILFQQVLKKQMQERHFIIKSIMNAMNYFREKN